MNKKIHIYTDGSSKGNPGPGGYGIFIETFFKNLYYRKIFYEGYRYTTNNRMELLAVITGLKKINTKYNVTVFTDSKYIVNAVEEKWIYKWNNNNFLNKKNVDLWKEFLKLFLSNSMIIHWVKSHDDNYINNYCDQLSVKASKKKKLKVDYIYEKTCRKKIFNEKKIFV
ncbi:ribonuclease HI [Blattabacterium cuenoti]|uniref:ribonuclease HI n=1 Tax=Blattabacterium cuenoti TaxID=1653831 RepID=UPI00163D3524|nr:ribonuclease H [Blattabacterium cuenoti]